MNKIDKYISVVIPVYNSQNTIGKLIVKLENSLVCFNRYSIILINDNSTDDSYKIIKSLADKSQNITVINLKKNVGQQKATFLGLKYASGEYIIIIDDDLANDPDDIIGLYNKILEGYDVVYGISKDYSYKPIFRNLGSVFRDILFNQLTGKPKNIRVSSFRIINRNTNLNIQKANTKFIYISMEILKYTNKIGNVYVNYSKGTISNYNLIKLVRLICNIYLYYSKQKLFKTKPLPSDAYIIGEIVNGEEI